jgi:peptide/nickel transport system permease protein
VVQGVVLFVASMIVLINVAVDVLYGFLDPRIRYE